MPETLSKEGGKNQGKSTRNKCYKENKGGWCDRKWWEKEGGETLEETTELMDEAWRQTSHVKMRRSTFGQNLLQRVFHKDSVR